MGISEYKKKTLDISFVSADVIDWRAPGVCAGFDIRTFHICNFLMTYKS